MSDEKYPFEPNWMNKEHLFHLHEFMVTIREMQEKLDKQWISVDDDLPTADCSILAYCESGYLFINYELRDAARATQLFTHWMPLPEPPTGGATGGATDGATDGEQIPFFVIGNGEPVPEQLKHIIDKVKNKKGDKQ